MSVRVAAALSILLTIPLTGQGQAGLAFKARIGLVVLHATVRDSHGDLITTLNREAFSVSENGKQQRISLFNRDDLPISIGLLLDGSGSMRLQRHLEEQAALALIRTLKAHDEIFLVAFADKVHLDVPLTTDQRLVGAGVARGNAIGGTALRDAVDMAETYIRERATNDRRVLVIFSDGNDNASVVSELPLHRTAERDSLAIYAVGLSNPSTPKWRDGQRTLEELARSTGGLAYFPSDADHLDSAVGDLARQIRSEYTIAYSPSNQALDGSYRSIRVEARGAGRLRVLTRPGYWASPQ